MAVAAAAVLVGACGSSGGKKVNVGAQSAGGAADAASGPKVDAASNGKIGDTILVDGSGLTLYRNAEESGATIKCTGACATTWPPMLASGGAAVAGAGVKGTLSTVTRPDGGVQVTFNGMPLYLFTGDKKAGDANGQGISQIWFAVPASGAATSSSKASTTVAPAAATGASTSTTASTVKGAASTTTVKSAASSSTTVAPAAAGGGNTTTTAAQSAATTNTTAHAPTTTPPTTASGQPTTTAGGGGGGGNTTTTDYYYP